ncbi:2OG-Fe(II) oxygenase [Caldimonas tepidiphila]|uniref:2OG-Fe(II) oxygenase n=1 Tax=Caldimonas tepidiphila TaxID=2315841 RepID=UPI000E5B5119|nr:2OG-Fe(II) oxygenase [Caldimonas tepidiphila]
MSIQHITVELRHWIVEQTAAGHSPQAVHEAMLQQGWSEEVAVAALEQALGEKIYEDGPPVALPEPDLGGSPNRIWAHDREVSVLLQMKSPRVVLFGGLLSDEECDELVALARERLARSETVQTLTGGSEVNAARTSEGMFFQRGEHPLCERIERRIAALVNWPVENGEGLQVLRYRPGAQYLPHYDYFDPAQPGSLQILKRGGQRVGTLVMYLNTPERGGATTFPDVQLEIPPTKGHAAFFSYALPHPSTRTLHGGAPVIEGEKWVATKWLREGRFD